MYQIQWSWKVIDKIKVDKKQVKLLGIMVVKLKVIK